MEAVAFHEDLLQRWRRSASSHKAYRHFLGQYLRFLGERAIAPGLDALTPQLVGQCQDWMRSHAQGKQGGAVAEATFVRCIKAFARALCEQGVYAENPVGRLKSVRTPKPHRKPYTDAELHQLLQAAESGPEPIRDRALMLLLLDTGCRIGELCNVEVGDVDVEVGSILFRHTKNGTPRQVLFRADGLDGGPCLIAVRNWLAHRPADEGVSAFFTKPDGQPLSERYARTSIVARIGKAAGVANAIPHRFRHTNASRFLSQRPGAEILLRSRLGHISPEILGTYVTVGEAMAIEGAQVASVSTRLFTSPTSTAAPLDLCGAHNPPPTAPLQAATTYTQMDDLVDQILRRLHSALAADLARQEERWAILNASVARLQETFAVGVSRRAYEIGDAPPVTMLPGQGVLSEREREVLQFVAQGMRTVAIVERLIVTDRTVKHHLTAIFRKLGVQNRVAATRRAVQLGLVSFPEIETATTQLDLSRRQREVLTLLPSRLTQPQIARRLGVEPSTVKHHVDALYSKMGARNRREAGLRAVELGLVEPPALAAVR